MMGAYVVCATTVALNFAVLGPLAGIIGLSAGVLIARRHSSVRQLPGAYERQIHIDQARSVAGYLQEQINTLGHDAPKMVRDDLYKQLAEANRRMLEIATADTPHHNSLPAPPLQLPAPDRGNRVTGPSVAK